RDPETLATFGGRFDGGPTSWRADILYSADPRRSYREFGIQIADFSLAYGAEGFAGSANRTPPINPPGKDDVGLPYLLRPPLARGTCPNGMSAALGCPEIISADDPGTMLINYRNEPVALRVRNPAGNSQPADSTGDLSLAYWNRVVRRDTRLNTFGPYGARVGEQPRDPFTPLMRTYEDDRILIRLLVGAHEEGHNWGINASRWLFERLEPNSGFRASQMAGISEWHEFALNPLMSNRRDTVADFQYRGGSAVDDQWNGQWGIIRAYRYPRSDLARLDARPVSSSRDAAEKDAAAGRRATIDGAASYSTSSTFPAADDSTTWKGDVQTLDATSPTAPSTTTNTANGTMTTDAVAVATESDSIQSGYGNDAQGGIQYDIFEYDPATGTEYVATSDPEATNKQLQPSSETLVADTSSKLTPTTGASAMGTMSTSGSSSPVFQSQSGSSNVGFWGVCPRLAPLRLYEISAIPASALPGGRLVYNQRTTNGGPLYDPTAVVYVYDADLVSGRLNRNPEPLILRANAGDCVLVRLRNRLPSALPDVNGFNTLPMIVDQFNANQVVPSARVGLHAQLVSLDVQYSDGSAVGANRNTTVLPGQWRWYQWYAGTVYPVGNGRLRATPAEFGAVNLTSSDRIQHSNKGAIAALIVEPANTQWTVDPNNRAAAVIRRKSDGAVLFKEGVVLFQDDVNLLFGSAVTLPAINCATVEEPTPECTSATGIASHSYAAGAPVPNLGGEDDAEDSGGKGLNYRTEPMWFRHRFAPDADFGFTRNLDFRTILKGDSAQTPIFRVNAGDSIRLRVLEPGGHARNHVFVLHGHVWEQEPYADSSRVIAHNPWSEWKGARDGHGPGEHFEVIPRHGAGGINRVPGDYLFRDQASFGFDFGIWGVLRVLPPSSATTQTTSGGATASPTSTTQSKSRGSCTIDPLTGNTTCGG
ncbi:MAG TPA: hypothetical protein VF541_16275, partial [Longimicrobium sp.]